MPASIEGAAPAKIGFCAFDRGTKTRKIEKNSHFRNTFITPGGKTSLPPYQTPRGIVTLSVDLGLGRPKSAGTSRKVHATLPGLGNVHLVEIREMEEKLLREKKFPAELPAQPTGLGPLRQEHSRVAHVFLESRPEFLAQKSFFAPRFEIERGPNDCESQPSAEMTFDERGADHGHQYAGINRVANPAVQTRSNQFVALFERYDAAPVSAERQPGPDAQANPECGE